MIYKYFIAFFLVISIILLIFATKFMIMIKVGHRNIELKALIEKGKSGAYRKLEAKKTFLKALRSFFVVIGILNDIEGLRMYRQYNYIKGVDTSSVHIIASKIKGILLFREYEEGKKIDILVLKY